MMLNIRSTIWRKSRTALIFAVRNLLIPILNISISLLVIQLGSETLWGGFVNTLIWVSLTLHILSWGNKEYLLRIFSKNPSRIIQVWQENLFTRGTGLFLAAGIFLWQGFPSGTYGWILLWLMTAFIAQSWEVIVLYEKQFGLAIFTELAGFGLIAGGLFRLGGDITLIQIVYLYAISNLLKSAMLTFWFRKTGLAVFQFSLSKKHLSEAFPFFLVGLSGMLNTRIDLYMANAWLTEDKVAVYQVMTSLFIYLQAFSGMITLPFVKNIYRLPSENIARIPYKLGGIGLVLLLAAIPATWWVLNGLYKFDLEAAFYVWGFLLAFPIYWYLPTIYLCYKHQKEGLVLGLNALGIAVNIGLNIYFIPLWDIKGALIASVIAQWVILFCYEYYRNKLPRPPYPAKPISRDEIIRGEKLRCPECGGEIHIAEAICTGGHTFETENHVLRLVTEKKAEQLDPFLEKFARFREKTGWFIEDPTIFPRLPFVKESEAPGFWRAKQADFEIIFQLLRQKNQQKILEIGAWNGWLSHHLVRAGHALTSVDYFIHPKDGQGAMKYYPEKWLAVQMEVEEMELLAGDYDMIILNRCFAYYTDPAEALRLLKQKLRPGGILLMTGLHIYPDGEARKAEMAAYEQTFLEENGFPLFSKPTRGYLDKRDKDDLVNAGVKLFVYRKMMIHNLKTGLFPGRAKMYYGVYNQAL
ncbi:MAG: polysaccharide biosynthesis C-terminal domain-containing protein [Bacteroidia bacterium]